MLHTYGNRLVSGLVVLAGLTACALAPPAERFDAAARQAGLTAGDIAGEGFRHATFATTRRAGSRLHIYVSGDGSPFLGPTVIARDPTPRRPLTLALMERDPEPSVLVGRPCYHGLMDGCDPALWTIERYSGAVVASMTAATRRLIETGDFEQVVLIGYSGGGVLALLVAQRLPAVDAVVTVAANLDIDAWAALHDYTPLTGSLNPAAAALRNDLLQLHLTGDKDDNVPPEVQRALTAALPPGASRSVAGFDHRCCWARLWPGPLEEIHRRLAEISERPPEQRLPADARGSTSGGYPESRPWPSPHQDSP